MAVRFPRVVTTQYQGEYIEVIPLKATIEASQWQLIRIIAKVISALLFCFSKSELYIVSIGEKSFKKPAIATDAVHILSGSNGSGRTIYQLVGIIRSNPPGEGHGGAVGGFDNVTTTPEGEEVLNSPLFTVLEESEEEIGAAISLLGVDKEAIRTDYNTSVIGGNITLGGRECSLSIRSAGTFKTAREELPQGGETIPGANGEKRVHLVRSVLVYVDTKGIDISDPENVKSLYRAGSDASAICVADVTDIVNRATTREEGIRLGRAFREREGWGIIHHGDVIGSACYELHRLQNDHFAF